SAIFPASLSPIDHSGKEQPETDFEKAKLAGVQQRDQGGELPVRRSILRTLPVPIVVPMWEAVAETRQ
ncbi:MULTISPECIES: hypothetical protein, partial [unclassified Sphingomonas]|uniref:hypothetical protein n=1 Tax=unclassified Sphingomonas TaxID=196159 RepID=UPI00226A8EA6